MTRIKKFFAPELKHYRYDLCKRWRIEYWEPSGNRIVIYGHINKANSIEERIRIANETINNLHFNTTPEKSALDKVIEMGVLTWRAKTTSAYKTVNDRYRRFLSIKKIKAETATEDTINTFLLWLVSEENVGNKNTIAKYRDTLYTLYNKACESYIITFNPVKKVAPIKRAPRSLRFFSDNQIQMLKAIDKPVQLDLAIKLLFYCFIRPGEQRHMKIEWINFEYGFIEIPGEVSKNWKTEKVSIPNMFLREIEHLKNYPNNFYVLSKSGSPGTVQISTKYLNDENKKLLNTLKIRGHYAFYSWKHTGVVKAVKAGVNIKDLQLQLRHHSLDMVNEYLKNLGVMDSDDLKNKFPTL